MEGVVNEEDEEDETNDAEHDVNTKDTISATSQGSHNYRNALLIERNESNTTLVEGNEMDQTEEINDVNIKELPLASSKVINLVIENKPFQHTMSDILSRAKERQD